jgi:phage replication-related protein YjqB (UPF0714/DUF867 family)
MSLAGVSDLLARWVALDERYQGGVPETEAVRVTGDGRVPIIFSAPHSVRHLRRGIEKKADIRTGGLAEVLAEATGGLAITSLGKLAAAPNWDSGPTPFRERLLDLLRPEGIVLDLHGMGAGHRADAVIGLGPAPTPASRSAAEALAAVLGEQGMTASFGHPFPATHPGTVTASVQAAGGTALQLELSARRRRPLREPGATGPLVTALVAWARVVAAAREPRGQ